MAQYAVGGRLPGLRGVQYVAAREMSGAGDARQLVRAEHTVGRRRQRPEGGERPENEQRPYPGRVTEPFQHPSQAYADRAVYAMRLSGCLSKSCGMAHERLIRGNDLRLVREYLRLSSWFPRLPANASAIGLRTRTAIERGIRLRVQ